MKFIYVLFFISYTLVALPAKTKLAMVPKGAVKQSVSAPKLCKLITNKSKGNLIVPNGTKKEYQAFIEEPPSGVTFDNCVACPTDPFTKKIGAKCCHKLTGQTLEALVWYTCDTTAVACNSINKCANTGNPENAITCSMGITPTRILAQKPSANLSALCGSGATDISCKCMKPVDQTRQCNGKFTADSPTTVKGSASAGFDCNVHGYMP